MKYSLNWLKEEVQAGKPVEYFFFWGHTQKQEGVVDKSCLSQWYPAAFTVDDITYPTAEHWMMAKKALLFDDPARYKNILETYSPAIAKKEGRLVHNFDEKTWKRNAYAFVSEGSFYKFSQHAELQKFLLDTRSTVLVEASPFDKIWGIGTKTFEKDPFKWRGTNLLGFALMEARDRLLNN